MIDDSFMKISKHIMSCNSWICRKVQEIDHMVIFWHLKETNKIFSATFSFMSY